MEATGWFHVLTTRPVTEMSQAILHDSTLCVGCRMCEAACAKRWSLPYNDTIAREERLSSHKLTAVVVRDDKCSRKLCMHCAEPACVSACPVSALQKTAIGPVIYQEERCMGCRYCMVVCPFQVPAYEWSSRLPQVRKCDMCYQRLVEGKSTACADYCPTGATITGDRESLIAEARKRMGENPESYYPRIYGLTDAGGTSVLLLSAVPLETFGIGTTAPQEPLPALTWSALSQVPSLVMLGSALLGGVSWIVHRRSQVAAVEENGAKCGKTKDPQ